MIEILIAILVVLIFNELCKKRKIITINKNIEKMENVIYNYKNKTFKLNNN